MSLLDLVQQQLGQQQVSQISQQIGADPNQTQSAIHAAIPMLLGGMAGQARQPGGASGLASMLGAAGGTGALGGLLGGMLGGGGGAGGGLGGLLGGGAGGGGGLGGMLGGLGGLLGGHEHEVQGGVQQASGLNGDQTKKLLMILAPIVIAAIAHQRSQKRQEQQTALPGAMGGTRADAIDSDGDGIPDYLEQEARHAQVQTQQRQPAIGGLLGKILDAAQRPPR